MAISEYRIILTATFNSAAQRDAAAVAILSAVGSIDPAIIATTKASHITRDDYPICETPNDTTAIAMNGVLQTQDLQAKAASLMPAPATPAPTGS